MSKQVEYRNGVSSNLEVRESDDGAYIFEGYACKFNEIDDYNSMFLPGAFTKTLQERGSKVKVRYEHMHTVGKPLELREDSIGLFVRGQLTKGVEKADECYRLIKDGVIDTLSFGFNTVRDGYKGGVRQIAEAKLMEISPVTFASNENAAITHVRSMNFNETLNEENVSRQGGVLLNSLYRTIDDIWWEAKDNNALMSSVNKALDQFKVQFMKYAQAYVDTFRAEDSKRSIFGGDAAIELRRHCAEQDCTIEEFALRSVFSIEELNGVLNNELSIPAGKLANLPDSIRVAYQLDRNAQMEQLCSELRENGNMTNADKIRLAALLEISSQPDEVQSAISKLEEFRSTLVN